MLSNKYIKNKTIKIWGATNVVADNGVWWPVVAVSGVWWWLVVSEMLDV
jgi:hypothetical protein